MTKYVVWVCAQYILGDCKLNYSVFIGFKITFIICCTVVLLLVVWCKVSCLVDIFRVIWQFTELIFSTVM